MNIINFLLLLYTYLLALVLRNYYNDYYFTVLTYTKIVITNNNYTYTVIYQSHCNVTIH